MVLALLTPLLLLSGPIPGATAAPEDENADPLRVTLTEMTPSSIPQKGPIQLSGTVTNTSEEPYEDVKLYPVVSPTPIGDATAVAQAADSDPLTTASGSRLTGEGQYADLDTIAPGSSRSFTLRIPRKDIAFITAPGVYWIGAQALGTNRAGRDALADGRARTFIPLVAPKTTTRISLIAPLREPVVRGVDTKISKPAELARQLGPDGRLGRIVDLLRDAPGVQWLVDPALLDAAADLRNNNPGLRLGTAKKDPEPSPSASPSVAQGAPAETLDKEARDQVERWLQRTSETLAQRDVLALPYADPDTAALMRHAPALRQRAHLLALNRLKTYGVSATPAVADPQGLLDLDTLPKKDPDLVAVASAPDLDTPASLVHEQTELLLPQGAVTQGGPGPNVAQSPLNLRQRILAVAALRATRSGGQLLVRLPDRWNPGSNWERTDFIAGLQSGWSQLGAVDQPRSTTGKFTLPYTAAQRAREIDTALIRSSQDLIQTSTRFAAMLDTENNVALHLDSVALEGTSWASRTDQRSAASLVNTVHDVTLRELSRVRVLGTGLVTLSGGSGTVSVSLLNELSQPVRIGLDVSNNSGTPLRVQAPEPVTLPAGQRTTVRLEVRTQRFGVNDVTISPVTVNGDRVGTPLNVTVRSSEVGRWFWSVMIGAGLVLVVMIFRRIRARIRTHRWRAADHPEPDGPHFEDLLPGGTDEPGDRRG